MCTGQGIDEQIPITTQLVKDTHQGGPYLRSNYAQSPQATSGGAGAFVRTLEGRTQDITDHLPRQANIACNHHSLIERTLGSTEIYLCDRNSRESGIADRSHRIRPIPVISVLDLVKHLVGGLHIHFLSRTSLVRT